MGAIYTIGYARLTPRRLKEILDLLRIDHLIDCRSSPRTRVAGFGPRQLETFFGARYAWEGRTLGGRGQIWPETIATLAARAHTARLMLMCMEHTPGDCHRHHTIAMPLVNDEGATVLHVFENQIVDARALQAAIDSMEDENDDPDYKSENLFEHAAREVEAARAQKGE